MFWQWQAVQMLEGGQSCENPQEVYFNHYRVLSAHDRHDELMRRAERIKTPEWRKNVKANREIIQAWEQAQSKG